MVAQFKGRGELIRSHHHIPSHPHFLFHPHFINLIFLTFFIEFIFFQIESYVSLAIFLNDSKEKIFKNPFSKLS